MQDLQKNARTKDVIATAITIEILQLNDDLKGKSKTGLAAFQAAEADKNHINQVAEERAALKRLGWKNPLLDLFDHTFCRSFLTLSLL